MANIITAPESGIYFDGNTAGYGDIPTLTGNASGVAIQYDGYAGIKINSSATGDNYQDRFSVEGANGRLFGVSDAVTGTVFSVNDAAGLPIIEVESTADYDKITIGEYGTDALVISGSSVEIGGETAATRDWVTGQGYVTASSEQQTLDNVLAKGNTSTRSMSVGAVTADQINMKDLGDYITFYGDDSANHAIGARNSLGSIADDIRINSYGAVYINLDSNNNNTSGADFQIGRHGANTTISDWLFTLNGENGNVGIGTTSPDYKLDVAGDIGVDGYIYHNGDDSRIGFEGNDAIRMYTANSVRLQIQSNGNVGIGNTNPTSKLAVAGNIQSTAGGSWASNSGGVQLTYDGTDTGILSMYYDDQNLVLGAGVTQQNNITINGHTSDNNITFKVANSERMRILSSGQLIVGGTAFGYAGTDLQVGNTSDSQNGLNIITSTTGYGYILFGDALATADSYVGQISYKHGDDYMAFRTAGTEKLRIDSSGNIGIGTTGPSAPLDVVGASELNGIVYISDSNDVPLRVASTDGNAMIGISDNNSTNGYANGIGVISNALYLKTNSVERLRIDSSGNVGIGDSTPSYKLDVNGTLRAAGAAYFNGSVEIGSSLNMTDGDISSAYNVYGNYFRQRTHGIPRSNLGDPTVAEMALFDSQFTCKTDLSNSYDDLSDLTFWVQDTSSDEWTEVTTYSDDQKRRFLRTNNSSVIIPNLSYKYRVEFNAKSYTFANALYMYWSSNSHTTQVHVWKYNVLNDAWTQHTSSSSTPSAWPGHLWLPFSSIAWHETNTTSSSHYKKIRIEFTPNWQTSNPTYSDRDINLYGGQIWGGYPTGRRTPHYYDQNGLLNTWGKFKISDVAAATTDLDRFLVSNSGEVQYRTGAQVLSDIGGLSTTGKAADSNLLDGLDSSQFLRSDTYDTQTAGTIAFGRGAIDPDSFTGYSGGFGQVADGSGWSAYGLFVHGGSTGQAAAIAIGSSGTLYFGKQDGSTANSMATWLTVGGSSRDINFSGNSFKYGNNTIWHAGNDGSGSGLDADLLDGNHASAFLTTSSASSTYLPLSGGTMTGSLQVSVGGAVGINIKQDTGSSTLSGRLFFSNATSSEGVSIYNSGGKMMLQTGATFNSTTGSTRMTIDSNGNVGIGTTSPGERLHVGGDIRVGIGGASDYNKVEFIRNGGSGVGAIGWHSDGNFYVAGHPSYGPTAGNDVRVYGFGSDLHLGDNTNGDVLTVQASSGNVGIGTTSPNAKLHVDGIGQFGDYANIGSLIDAGFYQDSLNGAYRANGTSGNRGFYFQANAGAGTKMYIGLAGTYDGRVGIGTASPADRLHISGGHLLFERGGEIRSKDTGGATRTIARVNASNELEYGWSSTGPVKFMGGNAYTERMRIHTNGNIGIGTTTSLDSSLNIADASSSNVKVTRIANDVTTVYRYATQADAVLEWTCGSYFHAEVVITASQTNSGTYNNLYIRGIWSNNYTSHHWDELEHIGGLTGSTFTITNGQNGSSAETGRLTLTFDYTSGSFSTLNVRITDFYGSHSYTIS